MSIHPRKAKAIRLGVYEAQKPGAVVASDMQREAVTQPPKKKSKPKAKPKAANKPKPAAKPKVDDEPKGKVEGELVEPKTADKPAKK